MAIFRGGLGLFLLTNKVWYINILFIKIVIFGSF